MKFFHLLALLVVIIGSSFGQINKSTLASNPAFEQAVAKQVRFPAVAQRLGKSVRVYVGFLLTDRGNYQDVAVINLGSIDESLKQEVDRLWHILPKQDPKYAGDYVIPIDFMLGEDGPDQVKPISNQEDQFGKPGRYTLLKKVSVTGWIVCEKRDLAN